MIAVWTGRTENDGFNRLVVELGVGWREAALIRALARYRQQSGLDPSQAVQEQALRDNPGVARLILDLFRTRFDPAIRADADHARHLAVDPDRGHGMRIDPAISHAAADRAADAGILSGRIFLHRAGLRP